jgi:hypothetical protein
MKRNSLALLLHPFKNALMPRKILRESIELFTNNLFSLASDFPHVPFNIVLPGYVLECINTFQLSQLRDLQKRGRIEWLFPGYTEPFFSISPFSLTSDNISHGQKIFTELTGTSPSGFMPAYSNWEPNFIELLCRIGIQYVVVSGNLLLPDCRLNCGYWITEHTGTSIPLIPTNIVHHYTAPADILDWLEKIYSNDKTDSSDKFTAIQYLIPLRAQGESDPYRWLKYAAGEIDRHILNYQPIRFSELMSIISPRGLQYIPPSLSIDFRGEAGRHFLNDLHSNDRIGLLQRKLIDVHEQINLLKDPKISAQLRRELFFLQDINHFLPGKESGFENYADRLWMYSKLIDIEKVLYEASDSKGGQIRITDFLKNGGKCVILSNKYLKIYLDYKNGGQIFEVNYIERSLNLCASYNPVPNVTPDIILPGKTKTWFVDRILAEETTGWNYSGGAKDFGNFLSGQFEYKVSTSSSNVKALLIKQGSILRGDKPCPLSMEKVFGIDKSGSGFSFVYQLSNPSLMVYTFRFATELTLSLPGGPSGNVRAVSGKQVYEKAGHEFFQMESVTSWYIEDIQTAVRIQFDMQKPIDVWFIPSSTDKLKEPVQGITIVLSAPVKLESTSQWKLIGKCRFRRLRKKGGSADAI